MIAGDTPRTRDGFVWTKNGTFHGLPTNAVVESKVTESQYDVIVIGAGFAGLTAARDISERSSLKVLVLEARDRIGGRTWTSETFGMDLEMGGTWVHWSQPHVWTELVRYNLQHDLKSSATASELVVKTSDGKDMPNVDPVELFTKIEIVLAEFFNVDGYNLRTLMPYPHDPFREPAPWREYDHLSVRARLDQMAQEEKFTTAELDLFENIACGSSLTTADQGSFIEFLRWIALGGYTLQGMVESSGTYKIGNGGMTNLARNILNDYNGDILFGAAVSEIRHDAQDNKSVTVKLSNGKAFVASNVISTIPLNVLSSIKFTPELTQFHQEAINAGQVNRGYKVHYKLASPSKPWTAMASQNSGSPFNTGMSDNLEADKEHSSHFVGFGLAGRIPDLEDDKAMVGDFHTYLDSDQKHTIAGYAAHDWTADPFSKGTWCAYAPGGYVKHHQELQKPHGRTHFASSDWADGWKGFVDGAIEEGKKAAVIILAASKA